MIIKNGLVFEPTGTFVKRDVYTDGQQILAEKGSSDDKIIDAKDMYVLPGLVDVHIHGAVGCDFCDGDFEKLSKIAAYLKSNGITSFCPTSMTLPEDQLKTIFQSIKKVPTDAEYAHIAGINMEGPFISPAKKGAQKESYIQNPSINMFRRLDDACDGAIRLVTLAPELNGSDSFIEEFHDTVSISLGHSAANYETASKAFALGANHVTHLFNAMPAFLHRDPGIIGAAADCAHAMAEIISDGIHIHPSAIRNAFQMFGEDRMILISDAMRATGMEDGEYELGGQPVFKKGRHATLADGTLAGSATNLFDCMRGAIQFGVPATAAIKAATINPARSIGMEQTIGTLAPGARADIILVNKDFELVKVL